jgi:hypothetical protein
MNRQQRRAARVSRRRDTSDGDLIVALDSEDLLRIVAGLVETDDTVSGATIITADGKISYVDAGQMRSGGLA